MYITIDGGTTNTRIILTDGKKQIKSVKIGIGARDAAFDGNNNALKKGVKDAVLNLSEGVASEIEAIIASGMITSAGGLCEIPHIKAPAGLTELSAALVSHNMPEVSEIPMFFVPGVMNDFNSSSDTGCIDVMRGEETETMGIAALECIRDNAVLVLPGSHNKIIRLDKSGRIRDCLTSMSGEMIRAASENTILKDSSAFSQTICDDFLKEGYRMSMENGMNAALFKARMLRNFKHVSKESVYSFIVGVVFYYDVLLLNSISDSSVYVGGSGAFRRALCLLIRENTRLNVIEVPEEYSANAVMTGACMIYKNANNDNF